MRIILDFSNGAVRVTEVQNPIGNWSRAEGIEVTNISELECLKALSNKLPKRVGRWNVPLKSSYEFLKVSNTAITEPHGVWNK